MRLIHIVETLSCGGMERFIIELAVSQRLVGHEVNVCCLFEPGVLAAEARSRGVPVVAFNRARKSRFSVLLRLITYFRSCRPDVVVTHNPGVHVYGALSARIAGVRSSINVRHGPVSSTGRPYREGGFHLARPVTDLVVCVSHDTADTLIKRGTLKSDHTRVIPNGIDTSAFLQTPATPGGSAPHFRIGTLGRLVPVKGHTFLLEAFAVLLKRLSTVELHIAGTGPLLSELECAAKRLRVTAQTSFLGQVHSARFLATLDLFVCCSSSEGAPISILEAMATGLPVVSRALGSVQEVAPEGEVAWYADTNDPAVFARVLQEALKSDQLVIRGKRARMIAQERFDISVTCEQYDRLLSSLPPRRFLFG